MIDFSLDWMGSHLFPSHAVTDSEYVIFGSAVLYLHGIREDNSVRDLDVFISRRVWAALFSDHARTGITVETPRAGDPPLLEYRLDTPIHFFYAWTHRDVAWISAQQCFRGAETVAGWRCASLAVIRRHKEKSYEENRGSLAHEKHVRDLALIDAHLAS